MDWPTASERPGAAWARPSKPGRSRTGQFTESMWPMPGGHGKGEATVTSLYDRRNHMDSHNRDSAG